jgi:serine/threonine protein kinase
MTPPDERLIERFERAWQGDDPPDLAAFAANASPAAARELVLIDLEYRWRNYQKAASDWLGPDLPPAVEEYARRFPHLQLDDELLAEEYRARHVWGDRPPRAAYTDRSPALADRLTAIDAELLRELAPPARSPNVITPPPPADVIAVSGYTIGSVIASGATGTVYAATSDAGEAVAVKAIHPHLLADADARGRFDREARLLLEVRHPNVVRVLAAERSGRRAVIVMDRVPGTDLARRVTASGPLPVAEACAVLAQAADGLAHLHARGIAHRDVSPSNLMLDDAGRVTLIDLGLAKRVGTVDNTSGSGSHSSWVTPEGNALFGTPDYVAPETVRDCTAAGPPADVYGLGAVGVFLLTGSPPFPAGGPLEKLFQHLSAPPPDLSALRPDAPPALRSALERCLAKSPEDRPPAAELAALFDHLRQPG